MSTRTDIGPVGAFPAFVRVYWMLLGHIPLFMAILAIAAAEGVSWRDGAAVAAWAALVIVKAVDVFRLRGTTGDGAPATAADFRAWTLRLTLVALGAWAAAHAIRASGVL